MNKPSCYNRPDFKDTVIVQDGWVSTKPVMDVSGSLWQRSRVPAIVEIPDPMSKGCQQHGPMGEATLHPEQWACDGCIHKPPLRATINE
jgi:hypothetical protein